MRAIIEIFLAIIFSVILGSGSMNLIQNQIKKESLIKVQKGLSPLVQFTEELTKKK